MSEVILTRNDLYNLVWSEPMLKLSKKYVISDVGLRKICISMNIPLPKAGHWMKLQSGKKVVKEKLTEIYNGKSDVKLELREEGKEYFTHKNTEVKQIQSEIKDKFKSELLNPEKLTSKDPLILAAKTSLAFKKKAYKFKGLIETGYDVLDIKVSVENVSRSLRFMSTLINVVRLRGHNIIINSKGTCLVIEGENIKVSCREKCKIVVVKQGNWDYRELHGNGLLSFKTEGYHSSEWIDGKRQIEKIIPDIIAKLEISVKDLHLQQEKNKIYFAKLEADRQKLRDIEESKERELRKFKLLLNEATRWEQIKKLRDYIDAVESGAVANNTMTADLTDWLNWARKKANWYDPTINEFDELLASVDKETLTIKKSNN